MTSTAGQRRSRIAENRKDALKRARPVARERARTGVFADRAGARAVSAKYAKRPALHTSDPDHRPGSSYRSIGLDKFDRSSKLSCLLVESSLHVVAPGGIESTRFRRREVQVWRVWLGTTESALGYYRAALCLEELKRAERFRFENLKRSYIVCRGGLRVLLGHYLGCNPREIEFACGLKGKPTLRGMSPVRFNISHSGGLALYAFTLDCELGVDVERLRELDDLESIASRFFCAAEASELLSLKPEDRRSAFFRCWTRKEAYVKAVGDGLSIPLDRFQVTFLPGDPCRFVHVAGDSQAALEWTLHDLELAPDYIGALAYRDSPRPITIRPAVRAEQLPAIIGSI